MNDNERIELALQLLDVEDAIYNKAGQIAVIIEGRPEPADAFIDAYDHLMKSFREARNATVALSASIEEVSIKRWFMNNCVFVIPDELGVIEEV